MQTNTLETQVPSLSAAARPHPWRGYFFIAAATFCWGAAATLSKAIFNGKVFAGQPLISPLVITQMRTTVAVSILALFLFFRGGTQAFKISRRDLVLSVLAGTLGMAGSNYFYYLAIQKTTVATAITIQNTAPVWVLLAMVARGKQRATVRRILAVLMALMGVALVIGLFHKGVNLDPVGVAAAMMAAFSFTFYNVVAQGVVSRNYPLKIMNYALLGAALMWLVINPPWRLVAQHYSRGQWAFLFAFGCLSMLLPYVFYFSGLKYLDPTRAVVTSCLEPVFAIMFSVLFVNETLGLLQVVGIVAVLTATVMVQKQ